MYITIPLHWLYINIDELSRVDIMNKSVSSNLGLFNPYKHFTLLVSPYLRNDLRSICHREKHNYKQVYLLNALTWLKFTILTSMMITSIVNTPVFCSSLGHLLISSKYLREEHMELKRYRPRVLLGYSSRIYSLFIPMKHYLKDFKTPLGGYIILFKH